MKLGRKTIKKAACLLGAFFLSGTCMASSGDKEALATQATYIGMSLNKLAKANTAENCSFDVDNSGTLLKNTASLIRANRIDVAQENLEFAARALERVTYNGHDCPFFSSMVHPYVGYLAHLHHDLESFAYASSR